MSKRKRRKFTAEFKAKVVLEALSERYTLTEIAQKYDLQPVQISKWKREFKENMSQVFESPKAKDIKRQEEHESHLYEQIGRLQVQLEWLKKKMDTLD